MMSGGDVDFLYVAAHGDFGKIEAPNGSGLSRTFLRNTIVEANRKRRRLKGVLFGSCKFGDEYNLIELLKPARMHGEEVENKLDLGRRVRRGDRLHAELADRYRVLRRLLPHEWRQRDQAAREDGRAPRQVDAGACREPAASHRRQMRRGRYRDIIKGETLID